MPRSEGHRRGLKTILSIISDASDIGIKFLTIYAFSSENWKRPKSEIEFLMYICEKVIREELTKMMKKGVRFRHIGKLDDLPDSLVRCIKNAEKLTENNNTLSLQLAFNYGSRREIVDAIKSIAQDFSHKKISLEDINEELLSGRLYTRDIPDPDLFIRTSGEMRISNFLLWQLCYTELYVTKTFWPDFNKRELMKAVKEYQKRQRRFGGVDD